MDGGIIRVPIPTGRVKTLVRLLSLTAIALLIIGFILLMFFPEYETPAVYLLITFVVLIAPLACFRFGFGANRPDGPTVITYRIRRPPKSKSRLNPFEPDYRHYGSTASASLAAPDSSSQGPGEVSCNESYDTMDRSSYDSKFDSVELSAAEAEASTRALRRASMPIEKVTSMPTEKPRKSVSQDNVQHQRHSQKSESLNCLAGDIGEFQSAYSPDTESKESSMRELDAGRRQEYVEIDVDELNLQKSLSQGDSKQSSQDSTVVVDLGSLSKMVEDNRDFQSANSLDSASFATVLSVDTSAPDGNEKKS